jgi:hypothetical protein
MGKNKHTQVTVNAAPGMAEAVAEKLQDKAEAPMQDDGTRPEVPPEAPLPDDGTRPGAPPEAPTPEDAAQLAEHEGFPIYEEEWNFCLTMAFMHTGADFLTDWGDIPFRMANFMLANPDAPVEAALIEVKMRTRAVVLPNADQRRVHLALTLFRAYVVGWHAIEGQDVQAKITADEQARYLARPPQKLDLTDTPFEIEEGPFDALSDLGKAR